MTNITALYFHEDDYLGYSTLPPSCRYNRSQSFLCESCGRVYGSLVITVDGKKNPYSSWGSLCKDCSPVGELWAGSFAHSIPGGFPFFFQYHNPPLGAIKHQLEMELNCYDFRTNQANPTIHLARSQCPSHGAIGHRQDSLHRHVG